MSVTTLQMVETSCWCGLPVTVPKNLYNEAQRNGKEIFCPVGHEFVFSNTEVERLKKEVTQLTDARDRALRQRDDAQRETRAEAKAHSATKGQLTRVKNRADRGVCQHCHRSFANVERHVRKMHTQPETRCDPES